MRRTTRTARPGKVISLDPQTPVSDPSDAPQRDAAAHRRDLAATARDAAALQRDVSLLGSPVTAGVQALIRAAAVDREAAARDREAAAADRSSAALDRARAARDDLTGAWRREAGLDLLTAEMNRAERAGSNLIVGYLDVAGLKSINDAFGHPAGDAALVGLVQTLHRHLRSYDSVIRMGGDEFVCILPDATTSAVDRRLDDIRQELRQFEPPITLRVGLASRQRDDTAAALLARADDALLASRGLPRALQPLTK